RRPAGRAPAGRRTDRWPPRRPRTATRAASGYRGRGKVPRFQRTGRWYGPAVLGFDPYRYLMGLRGDTWGRRHLERQDREALREMETSHLGLPNGLELEWLGVAGFRLSFEGHTLLIDPYVSRVSMGALLRRRPALP